MFNTPPIFPLIQSDGDFVLGALCDLEQAPVRGLRSAARTNLLIEHGTTKSSHDRRPAI
jgi:hypothetical protein